MNNNYKWKGVTFNSKGIIIDKTPPIIKIELCFRFILILFSKNLTTGLAIFAIIYARIKGRSNDII